MTAIYRLNGKVTHQKSSIDGESTDRERKTGIIIIICEHKRNDRTENTTTYAVVTEQRVCVKSTTIGLNSSSLFFIFSSSTWANHKTRRRSGRKRREWEEEKNTQIDFVNILWHFIPCALYRMLMSRVYCSSPSLPHTGYIIAKWTHDVDGQQSTTQFPPTLRPRELREPSTYTRQIFIFLFISTSNKLWACEIYST